MNTHENALENVPAESGVANCPCCGDAHMVSDINTLTLCADCTEACCAATTDSVGDLGYWDCQLDDPDWDDEGDDDGDSRGYVGSMGYGFNDRDCSGVYDGVGGVVSDADPGL